MVGDTKEETYANLSPFVRLLETKGRVQILDALIHKSDRELTASEIAQLTGTSTSTISRNMDELVLLEMVTEYASKSQPTRYQINTENEIVKHLVRFHLGLSEHAEKILSNTDPVERDIEYEIIRNIKREYNSDDDNTTDDFEHEAVAHALGNA